MKIRDIIVLIVALLLAVGVAYLTRTFLVSRSTTEEVAKKEEEKKKKITKILVTGRALSEGTTIASGDFVWKAWPVEALGSEYIREGTIDVNGLNGVVVRKPLNKGEPVLQADFVRAGEKGFLAAILDPGMRAVAIDVTPQSALSGLIQPGDRVDVILAKRATATAQARSTTILSDVKVLAIDLNIKSEQNPPKEKPKVAVLQVTPKQAETLTAASKEGTLSLSLHSLEEGQAPAESETVSGVEETDQIILLRGNTKQIIEVQE